MVERVHLVFGEMGRVDVTRLRRFDTRGTRGEGGAERDRGVTNRQLMHR